MSRAMAVSAAVVTLAVACTKVPFTDRSQFNVVPAGTMNSLGKNTYKEMLGEAKVQRSGENAALLSKVGGRIAKVADEPNFEWSYALIVDEQMNAWCLPGGYIGFYTGILPVLQNEAGMAFVMGHEVGHAIAKHGAERMTQQLGVTGALALIDMVLSGSSKVSEQQRGTILGALGVGAQFGVLLPFSRAHEKEADTIGMMYMAGAGYPPAESIKVWERLEALAGKSGPALLSTHPSFDARKENQQEWMPEARKRYERNQLKYDTRALLWRD
jgi:predicted Zn-dependent protease